MPSFFHFVEDPNSPEGRVIRDYIEKHEEYLPASGEVILSKKDINHLESQLFNAESPEHKIEEALVFLSHKASDRSVKIFKKYECITRKKNAKIKVSFYFQHGYR